MMSSHFPAPAPDASYSLRDDILALSVEQGLLRACLLEKVDGEHRVAGWINVQGDAPDSLNGQLATICRRLGQRLGRILWDEALAQPYIYSNDLVRHPPLGLVLAAASPIGPLRVWVAGLSARGGLDVVRQALTSMPAQVVGVTQLAATTASTEITVALNLARPDALVVVGGYDNANPQSHQPLLSLCKSVAQAVTRLSPSLRPALFYAGNRFAADQAAVLLQSAGDHVECEIVSNLHPRPDLIMQTALIRALNYLHWQIGQRQPGVSSLSRWVTSPANITSVEWSFIQFAHAWMELQNISELHAAYRGPSWTLHCWTRAGQEALRIYYGSSNQPFDYPADWPSISLLSGHPPAEGPLPPSVRWWDRSSMLPLVATVGQSSPRVMLQAIRQDLLEDVNSAHG